MDITTRPAVSTQQPVAAGSGAQASDAKEAASHYLQAQVTIVEVSGEIDLHTGPQLREVLRDLLTTDSCHAPTHDAAHCDTAQDLEPQRHVTGVVVDLRAVTFMDSYALGVLVFAAKRSSAGGYGYALVSTSPITAKLFEMTGLDRVMPLHPDLDAALASLPST